MLTKTINPEDWLTTLRENGCKVTEALEVLVYVFVHSEYPLNGEQAWETPASRARKPAERRPIVSWKSWKEWDCYGGVHEVLDNLPVTSHDTYRRQ